MEWINRKEIEKKWTENRNSQSINRSIDQILQYCNLHNQSIKQVDSPQCNITVWKNAWMSHLPSPSTADAPHTAAHHHPWSSWRVCGYCSLVSGQVCGERSCRWGQATLLLLDKTKSFPIRKMKFRVSIPMWNTFLGDHQAQNRQRSIHNASVDGFAFAFARASGPIAADPLGHQQTNTAGRQHTLLHREALLVVSPGNLADIALENGEKKLYRSANQKRNSRSQKNIPVPSTHLQASPWRLHCPYGARRRIEPWAHPQSR